MALPTTNLSLNAIHIEIGGTTGTQCSLNDTDIRAIGSTDAAYDGGDGINQTSGTQVSIGEFRNAAAAETPVVSIQANGDTNFRSGNNCTVGQTFRTDGDEVERTPTGGDTAVTNTWLISGSAGDVWVTFVKTAGGSEANFGLSNSPTRYRLNADVKYELVTTVAEELSIYGYFEMWDAATNGTKLDDNGPTGILWQATREDL